MLALRHSCDQELQDCTFTVLTHVTSMRAKDVYRLHNDHITKFPLTTVGTVVTPRHYAMDLAKSKSNPTGDRSRDSGESLLHIVMCTCAARMLPAEKKEFIKAQTTNAYCLCVRPCAFSLVTAFLRACPDPAGSERNYLIAVQKANG
jgi:hypothetical protein